MDTKILFLVIVPWLIAGWAMAMMIASFLKQEPFTFGRFFGGGFATANYNRKYFRIFAICVLVDVGIVALINALYFTGWFKF